MNKEKNLLQIWNNHYGRNQSNTILKDKNFFELEINAITKLLLNEVNRMKKKSIRLLELGSGTGFLASRLTHLISSKTNIKYTYIGIDFSKAATRRAKNRKLKGYEFYQKDFFDFLGLNKEKFDFIITQRSIMAIMNPKSQQNLLALIKKSITRTGRGIFSEVTNQSFKKIQNLRKSLGISPLEKVWHSRHLNEEIIRSIFSKVDKVDFSSTYWLITRVIYPYFQEPRHNTQLHNFASKISQTGDYGMVKIFIVKV